MLTEAHLVSSRRKSRYAAAEGAARRATELDPDEAENWVTLGRIAATREDWDDWGQRLPESA